MSEGLPIVYTFRRCPYAMRARMALHASGVAFEWREIVLRDKPQAMLAASAKGTVPVLILPTGAVIDESLDIVLWALSENDPLDLLPDNSIDRKTTYDLIADNDGPFKQALDRYKYATRYEDADPILERDKGEVVLNSLNERLEKTEFLVGERLGLADIAIFPFIRQFRIADREWFDAQPYDALKLWLNARMASNLFTDIMIKRAPWKPDDEPFYWPSAA